MKYYIFTLRGWKQVSYERYLERVQICMNAPTGKGIELVQKYTKKV